MTNTGSDWVIPPDTKPPPPDKEKKTMDIDWGSVALGVIGGLVVGLIVKRDDDDEGDNIIIMR